MLKKCSFILLFLLLQFSGFTQILPDSSFMDIAGIRDSALAVNKTWLFFDSNNVATLDNILQQQFVPLTQFGYKKPIRPNLVSKFAYLRLRIFNSKNIADTIYFLPGIFFDNIIVYKLTDAGKPEFSANASTSGFCYFTLDANERKNFIVKLDFCRYDYNSLRPQLIRPGYLNIYRSVTRAKAEDIRIVGFVTSGMLFIILFLALINYFFNGKKEFLYYLGYASAMFLLVFMLAFLNNSSGSFASFFNGYLDLFLLITGNVFYLAFTRYFIETKTNYKTLDKTFRRGEWFLLSLLLVFTIVHYFTEWYMLERFLENLMKFIALSIGIFFIITAFKQKQKLIIYLGIGSAFAVFFSLISLIIILASISPKNFLYSALFHFDLGTVFALSFFLLGLTYKNRKELIERIKDQEALKVDVEKKVLENQIAIIKAQQEERNRISADMHDDLGAGMTTIRLYSELAKGKLGDNPMPEIEKISSSANELLNKMNAIIWSMSSSNDSLGNMVAYIRSYSLEYFENTGINCRIIIPEGLPNVVVSGEIRRNVFLVVKEALNNILKHSKATEVTITLERVADGLKLFIQDNGVGINFEKIRQFGNGLKNMKKRMDDIGVNFSIENNNGTLITLHRIVTTF